jgi:hypothetical protein
MSDPDAKGSDPTIIERKGENLPIFTSQTQRPAWWKLGGEDISFATVDPASVTTSSSGSLRDDIETNGKETVLGSVFDDSGAAQFYQPIEKYEGKHRFDPNATWTPEEERKLVRTVRLPHHNGCMRIIILIWYQFS